MSLKSSGSREPPISNGDILRSGLLRKLRSYRKKWFVLRDETPDTLARLEYYDSEKTFRRGLPPKRSIALKTCFNINRRQDTKHKYVIALYTKDDCLCIILDKLEEFDAWLKDMLRLQQGEEIPKGVIPKPKYEHVWQVYVCRLFLGEDICGYYRLCLSEITLSLVRLDNSYTIDMDLGCVRSCIQYKNFIHVELGRSSMLGEGHLWIEADDKNVAFYMNKTIYQRMKAYRERNRDALLDRFDILPITRIRSSSATEPSKSSGLKKFWFPFSSKPNNLPQDNQPHSNSESSVNQPTTTSVSTASTGGGGIIHHQRTQSLPLATPTISTVTLVPVVDNHSTSNIANHSSITNNTPTTTVGSSTATTISHHPSCSSVSVAKRPTSQSSKSFRDRCESMPCRPRTSSEGNHGLPPWVRPCLIPHRSHMRDVSHSPPTGSPMSPPSDSTGSSYSLPDDNECCAESEPQRIYNVPLTPDEAIAEEECTESPTGAPFSDYMSMGGPQSVDDGFQDMLPPYNNHQHSNNTSMNSVKSGTPSTDIRFSDYPLDKVVSYLTDDDNTRPARAWSVGSKPPGAAGESDTRTRAFSVGSKTKKIMGRVLPHYSHPGIKSSSAPILSSHRAPNSSVGPMGDLMEMDFTVPRSRTSTNESKNSTSSSCNHRNSSCAANKRTPPGYMDMKCGEMLKMNGISPYVDMSQKKKSNDGYVDMTCGSAALSGYMDMSGGSTASPKQNPVSQSIVDTARYLARASSRDDYVDMEANSRRSRTNSKNYNTAKPATSPGYQWPTPNDYLDMSGGSSRRDRSSFSSQLSSSPNVNSISPKSDFMSLGFGHNFTITERGNQTPEGYVEMTPGHVTKHQRQSSLDGSRSTDEYLDMSGGSKKPTVLNKDRIKSQPVSIQATTTNNQTVKISSPITISSLLGRKNSTGTPPRMHLPLTSWASNSPYASLPRQPRKNSSSKESSTSNSVTTTPSSSSTMFPISLNSPSSPASKTCTPTTTLNVPYKKPNIDNAKYTEDYAVMDFERRDSSAERSRKQSQDYVNFCPGKKIEQEPSPPKVRTDEYDDYAIMAPTVVQRKSSGASARVADQVPSSLVAGTAIQTTKSARKASSEDFDDYAMMAPSVVVADAAKSNTLPLRKGDASKATSLLSSYLSDVDLKEDRSTGCKPTSEVEQRLRGFSPTTTVGNQVPSSFATGGKSPQASTPKEAEESPYETLRPIADLQSQSSKGGRPKSTNSDKTKSPCSSSSDVNSRPSSVCSESSRLGSTSSVGSGSSSSTLIGSSRPESVNSDRTSSGLSTNADRGLQLQSVQLHYASLDLAQTDDSSRSPRMIKNSSSEVNLNDQPTFVYADIDFVRSEELKNSSNVPPSISSNTKVK